MVSAAVAYSRPQVMASHVAGTGVVPMDPQARGHELAMGFTTEDAIDTTVEFTRMGVPFAGPIGYVAGAPIGVIAANRNANKQREAITHEHRDMIAKELNIPPEAVHSGLLELAAQNNDALREALESIDEDRSSFFVNNIGGIAGVAGGTAAGLALLTTPPGWIAGGIGALAGAFAGEGLMSYFTDKGEKNHPLKMYEKIREKHKNNEPITALDIFTLRVAQNPNMQEYIKHHYDDLFGNLEPEVQQRVMYDMRGFSQACAQDAALCNDPSADLRALMWGLPMQRSPQAANANNPAPVWAKRVANTNQPVRGGFVEAEMRRREMAALHPEQQAL